MLRKPKEGLMVALAKNENITEHELVCRKMLDDEYDKKITFIDEATFQSFIVQYNFLAPERKNKLIKDLNTRQWIAPLFRGKD